MSWRARISQRRGKAEVATEQAAEPCPPERTWLKAHFWPAGKKKKRKKILDCIQVLSGSERGWQGGAPPKMPIGIEKEPLCG